MMLQKQSGHFAEKRNLKPLLGIEPRFLGYAVCSLVTIMIIQGEAERTPLFGKLINLEQKKIRQMFFYFWKVHRMPFHINVF